MESEGIINFVHVLRREPFLTLTSQEKFQIMASLGPYEGNNKCTCYVQHSEQIIPVCVSSDTRLKDLGKALHEARSHLKLGRSLDEDPKRRSSVVLVIAPETGDAETVIEQVTGSGEQITTPIVMPRLSLKGYILYTYMWLTFQWIEPKESGSYSGKLPFAFYKIMRAAVALSLWIVVAFEIYNLVNGLPALLANTDTVAAVVAVMHRLLWTLRYVILHHLGLYFFHAHRGHVSDVLNNNHRISQLQWRKSHRLIQDLMAVSAFFLIALPLIQKLIPIFLERASGIPRNWDATVETVEFFVLVYSRVVAMPIFFFFILVVEIHILELKDFEEQTQHNERGLTDLFNKYKSLTSRIRNSSRAFQPYLIGLLFLLVLWGTISVYSSVEMFQHIPSRHNILFSVILSESLGTLLVFLCETVFLFLLPLYKSGQISSLLSRLIFIATTLDSEEQRRKGFVFDTEEKILQFATLLETHQRYGNVGFKVAGLHITQLKSVWLTLLGPVIAFVGNFLIREHF